MSDAPVNRERLLAIVAGVCLGLLLADRLLFTPLWQAWRSRATEVQRLQVEVARAKALVEQESHMRQWRQDTNARLLASAPAEAENQLINQVDGWARITGLTVTALRPDWQPANPGGEAIIQLQVSAVGRLETVVRFLHTIDTSPLAVAVDQVEMAQNTSDNTALSVELRLSALCLQPAAAAPATGNSTAATAGGRTP